MRPAVKLFVWLISIIAFLSIILTILYISSIISEDIFVAIASGAMVSLLNFILGISAIKIGYTKSPDVFIKTILGGTFLRLFLLAGTVIAGLKILDLSRNSFIFSVLFFYVFFLIVEIFYLNFRKI
jgi:hypothetical protein